MNRSIALTLVVGMSCAIVGASTTPAAADYEQVLTARVTGLNLTRAIQLKFSEVFQLETYLGVIPASLAISPPPPTGYLGPSYLVAYTEKLVDGTSYSLEQLLYPYAVGRPWVYTGPGQSFFNPAFGGAFNIRSRWLGSPDVAEGVRFLRERGLPPPTSIGGKDNAWSRWIRLAIVSSAFLTLVGAFVLRRRRAGRSDGDRTPISI